MQSLFLFPSLSPSLHITLMLREVLRAIDGILVH